LSRKAFPKQFIPLIQNKSLLQLTMERLTGLAEAEDAAVELEPKSGSAAQAHPYPYQLICVSSEDHRFLVADTAAHLGLRVQQILEPQAKNTAAAMALAALAVPLDTPLLFCPADHHIPDAAAFARLVLSALPAVQAGSVVTFGVLPTSPSTAYGYIQKGPAAWDGFKVAQFVEKPNQETAQQYVDSGNYAWNSGMFLFKASSLLEELAQYDSVMLDACKAAWQASKVDLDFTRLDKDAFAKCPSQSIDYAVMEKTQKAVVVPLDAGWNDVGAWSSVWQVQEQDHAGNATRGDVILENAKNSYVHADHRLVTLLGVEDLIVVETSDAVLVAHKNASQDVKKIVDRLKKEQRSEADLHREVFRPWGSYDSIDIGQRYQVKRITVKPGAKLSVQMHHHRAEHWIVVSGTAKVRVGDVEQMITENQSVYIPIGDIHSLENPGKVNLELIEVQSGSYLGEDDIVRFEDKYGRA
jgi:mannose-1-phosphate guanylyltransferase